MQQDTDLAEYFMQIYEVFNSGDVSRIEDLISSESDISGFGTDPQETWRGQDVLRAFQAQPTEMHAAGLRFKPGTMHAYSEGTVGWITDQPTLMLADGGAVPMRISVVCHQEDDKWKMVHFHLSIGVPNQESIDEELTV